VVTEANHELTSQMTGAIAKAFVEPGRTASIGTLQFSRRVLHHLAESGYTLAPIDGPATGCCGRCDSDAIHDGSCACTPVSCGHVGVSRLTTAEKTR